ncbi:Subunit of tRNA-specific adenosine-34 deaminase [Phaffia rhodozyma]|uniref:Subunit of tRNA-specific adenosine-34 deaminase n=1 Tax=Phaffia rhodozyma TaxID=264483 RepID=A0A0F7SN77_PHARH|nr:Subunit of tRNA-specific adenosine-34 deaminase [Phaffia rhodozyma]
MPFVKNINMEIIEPLPEATPCVEQVPYLKDPADYLESKELSKTILWADLPFKPIRTPNDDYVLQKLAGADHGWEEISMWAVELPEGVAGNAVMKVLMEFAKQMGPKGETTKHLKRVRKFQGSETGVMKSSVALCATNIISASDLQAELMDYSLVLATLAPYEVQVPAQPGRTPSQTKIKSALWPVPHLPFRAIQEEKGWSKGKAAWIQAGIERVVKAGINAGQRGELPIAAHVAAPPPSIFPQDESEIPPTPFIQASSLDNRRLLSHPLRHATLSCISQIASIRNLPLGPEEAPTRNGADYLLTSLTLFITHEPCVLCSMALVHSRVREVIYVIPNSSGGFSTPIGIHGNKSLNHQFKVYWADKIELGEGEKELLTLPQDICV